jgi:hypothetical protein
LKNYVNVNFKKNKHKKFDISKSLSLASLGSLTNRTGSTVASTSESSFFIQEYVYEDPDMHPDPSKKCHVSGTLMKNNAEEWYVSGFRPQQLCWKTTVIKKPKK